MSNLTAAAEKPIILELLSKNKMTGYEIIGKLERVMGQRVPWKHGCLYPLLKSLENEGKIKSYWARASDNRHRRYYTAKQLKSNWLQRLLKNNPL